MEFVHGLCGGDEEGKVELVVVSCFWEELDCEVSFAFGGNSQVYNFEGFELFGLGDLHVGVEDLSKLEVFGQEGVVEQPQLEFDGYTGLIDKGDLLLPGVAFDRNAAEVNLLVLDKYMGQDNVGFDWELVVFRAFDIDLHQTVNVHNLEGGQFKAKFGHFFGKNVACSGAGRQYVLYLFRDDNFIDGAGFRYILQDYFVFCCSSDCYFFELDL